MNTKGILSMQASRIVKAAAVIFFLSTPSWAGRINGPLSGAATITGVTAGTGLSGGGTTGAVSLTNTGVVSISSGSGISATASNGSITLSTLVSTYAVSAAGTAYSMTASSATLDFGTTDPTLTLTQAGTYIIIARANIEYTAATFAANRTLTLKIRRTNNTAADVVTTSMSTRVTTTVTDILGIIDLPAVIYTTTNTNDALALTGFLSVVPTAGTLDATEASIVAVRIF